MPPSNTWVLKLGGAMHAAAELPAWLAACAARGEFAPRCVVVAGGGAFADQVRALQARWHFSDQLAHDLALDTMRLNARLLHGLAPQLPLCSAIDARQLAAHSVDGSLLWAPPADFAPSALPANWSVSSDSIALWLAQALGAQAVLLVKSVPADALRPASAACLAAQGVVDGHFPQQLRQGGVLARLLSKSRVGEFEQHLRCGTLPGVSVE
jgi:aspartokinase-like uncharacterized kinase